MKPRILFFQPTLGITGGIDRQTAALAARLGTEYEASFLTAYPPEHVIPTEVSVRTLGERDQSSAISRLGKLFARARALARFAAAERTSIIIASADGCIISALIAKRFFGMRAPVIAYVHQEIARSGWTYRLLLRLLLPTATVIVGVSDGIVREAAQYAPSLPIQRIYNASDVDQNRRASLEPLEHAGDEAYFGSGPVFVSIGRLAYAKAHWRAIEAMASMAQMHPDARLLIIGEGPERAFLERRIADLHLGANVVLLGERKNVFPYLRRATALVQPSFFESFGLTLVESLSVGTPIVASDCRFGPSEILTPGMIMSGDRIYPYRTPYGYLVRVPREGRDASGAEPTLLAALHVVSETRDTFSATLLETRAREFDIAHGAVQWTYLLGKVREVACSAAEDAGGIAFVGMNSLLVPFAAAVSDAGVPVSIYNGYQFPELPVAVRQAYKPHAFFGLAALARKVGGEVSLPFYLPWLQRNLRAQKPDAIVVMDFIRFWFWQAARYARRHPGTRLFVYVETKRMPSGRLSKLLFPLFVRHLKRAAPHIDRLFVYTNEGKDFLSQYVDSAKITVLPVPVDTERFHPQPAKEWLPEGKLRVLMNARFVAFKRHADVLQAVAGLSEPDRSRIQISFVGAHGDMSGRIGALVRELKLSDQVRFLPPLPHDRIREYYWAHDALVLPSFNEAIGMVVPEALACGIPTITSDTVGANVYVEEGKTGLIFPTGGSAALGSALSWMLTADIASMGARAAERMRTTFGEDRLVSEFLAALGISSS